MKTNEMIIGGGLAVVGAWITQLLGGWDMLMATLLVLMAADYASGLVKAAYRKELSSSVGFKGIMRKAGILLVVLTAAQLDLTFANQGHTVRSMVCIFYCANEGISILENVAMLGVHLPKVLVDLLKTMQKDQERA